MTGQHGMLTLCGWKFLPHTTFIVFWPYHRFLGVQATVLFFIFIRLWYFLNLNLVVSSSRALSDSHNLSAIYHQGLWCISFLFCRKPIFRIWYFLHSMLPFTSLWQFAKLHQFPPSLMHRISLTVTKVFITHPQPPYLSQVETLLEVTNLSP